MQGLESRPLWAIAPFLGGLDLRLWEHQDLEANTGHNCFAAQKRTMVKDLRPILQDRGMF